MKIILALCIGLLGCSGLHASEPAIRLSGSTLSLKAKQRHSIKLQHFCACARIEDSRIISQSKRGTDYYVVLSLSGPSKAVGDMHYCGAGIEANLVWLKLDAQFVVKASASHLVDSCFNNVETTEAIEYDAADKKMHAKFISFTTKQESSLDYDPAGLENGFHLISTPVN